MKKSYLAIASLSLLILGFVYGLTREKKDPYTQLIEDYDNAVAFRARAK